MRNPEACRFRYKQFKTNMKSVNHILSHSYEKTVLPMLEKSRKADKYDSHAYTRLYSKVAWNMAFDTSLYVWYDEQ